MSDVPEPHVPDPGSHTPLRVDAHHVDIASGSNESVSVIVDHVETVRCFGPKARILAVAIAKLLQY